MHSSIFPISNPTSHSKSLPFVTSNFFYKFSQPSSTSPSIFLLSMELALSVGSLGAGETSRKRGICTLSSDRIRQDFSLKGRDEVGTGGMRNCAPVQLDLKLSWSTDMGSNYKAKRSSHLDVNKVPPANDRDNEMGPSSSDSRLTMTEMERASSRCSDEEEGGVTRKKLRLSKEQSCYLEESFKEHQTLNPKQKLALAKQLNLQPRQVEVWFQNRRARTKLKQTEVDCEYLKRCCESLTEENRRLHRELQDLKALKSSQNSVHMQVPATTLTMCPSCERVTQTPENGSKAGIFGAPKSRLFPFPQRTSAAS